LSATQGGVDPGRQLITVIRKGTRAAQELPASTDAFVWLRLYQLEMDGIVPKGRTRPLWWTVRQPVRPLTYHAVHRMFERVNKRAGTFSTLHSLRHTAAYRMEARGIASDASFGRFGDRDSVRDLGFRTGRPARWRRGRHAL
jgi:integrase